MAYLARALSFVVLFVAVCAAQNQQQSAQQQGSQVKLEDIERDTNQRPPSGAVQQGPGPQGAQEVPQLTAQQIAAFQQQYLAVQPQQYFAPQFAYPEFQGVPLTYVPAPGNHLGGVQNVQNGVPQNVPQFQAYFVPQSPAFPHHVVPVVHQPGQVHPDAYRQQFVGQPQFIQHPAPQGQAQGQQQGARTVSVVPPNNSVYRTIQPPFGANLIYTNPPQLPQQIIFTQPQPGAQQFGVNSFSQRPSKAQFSSGVKSTPAPPTKSPDYNNYSQAASASSSSVAVSTSSNDQQQQQYRFSG